MKALVCLSVPVFLERSVGPANMISQVRPKNGVRNGGSYRWYHSKKPLTNHRPQIPTRPVHAEYTLGRLPAPVVLYERKALRSAKDTMGTTRG